MSLRVRLPALVPDAFAADDDRALVRRFAESHDEAAFAAVVARHARMVYGVCRRAVRDAHLAEDAFQAVFLVLARNPNGAVGASAIGGWLFGVARRVGLAARRREQRYAKRQVNPERERRGGESPDFDDLLRVVDEELAALPEAYRAPLVACFLEERTQDEAARHLGWSLSTLRRRLDRGKELLRARLTRRGATLAGGLFAGALAPSARATVPVRLLEAVNPSATPSAVAGALAAEVVGRSLVLKIGLAVVAVAMGFGGLIASQQTVQGTGDGRQETVQATGDRKQEPVKLADASKWVTVRGRVVFPQDRAIPAARLVPGGLIKDAEFFGTPAYRDTLIDPATRGVANAVVWLRPDSDDRKAEFPAEQIHPALATAKPTDHVIQTTRDGFTPRVTAARAGDRLIFSNPTPVGFNVRYQRPTPTDVPMGWESGEFNVLLPPGRSHTTKPLPALRAADAVADMIHPWVHGSVWAFDHPYFAVTDAKGNFTIEHAPAGPWRVVVWHETAGYRSGAKGRTGERVTLAPEAELTLVFESESWGKTE